MVPALQAANELVAALLLACDAAVSQKSAGTLFSTARGASTALRKYYGATGAREVTIAFTLQGVAVEGTLHTAPDHGALLHDLACLFECTLVLSNPEETGFAILMRRLADEVREPGLGGLEDIPGVRVGPPLQREAVALLEELEEVEEVEDLEDADDFAALGAFAEVEDFAAVDHEASTRPPPPGHIANGHGSTPPTTISPTKPPPDDWNPSLLAAEDPFEDL